MTREEIREAALEIIDPDRPCEFDIDEPISDDRASTCEVEVNDTVYDKSWSILGSRTLRLLGEACDSIQHDGASTIDMTCDCGA